jgi:hypothetical protein
MLSSRELACFMVPQFYQIWYVSHCWWATWIFLSFLGHCFFILTVVQCTLTFWTCRYSFHINLYYLQSILPLQKQALQNLALRCSCLCFMFRHGWPIWAASHMCDTHMTNVDTSDWFCNKACTSVAQISSEKEGNLI